MTSEAPDALLAGTERKPLEVAFATGPWSAAHPTQQEAEAYQIVTESLVQNCMKIKLIKHTQCRDCESCLWYLETCLFKSIVLRRFKLHEGLAID